MPLWLSFIHLKVKRNRKRKRIVGSYLHLSRFNEPVLSKVVLTKVKRNPILLVILTKQIISDQLQRSLEKGHRREEPRTRRPHEGQPGQ